MSDLVAIYLFALSFGLIVLMGVQWVRQTRDLFSIRNVFLLGVLFFQLISAGLALTTENYALFTPSNPGLAGLEFSVIISIFLVLFLFSYRRGWVAGFLAARIPLSAPPAGVGTMFLLSSTFLAAGFISRVFLGYIPIAGSLFGYISTGLLAVAAGMAIWAWLPRFWNPAVAIPAMVLILLAFGTTIYGTFGRREMLGFVMACMWAGYFAWWKYRSVLGASVRIAVLGFVGLILLAGFSATRGEAGKQRSTVQIISDMSEASLSKGMAMIFSPQDAGPISMWVCESRPESIPYEPLHQAWYLSTHWIPRAIWPGKPDGLGAKLVEQRNLANVGEVFTVGPGLVGHIVNDNPWLALVPYAIGLGLLIRFFDHLLVIHAHNPFLVLPLGVGLANWMAVPRGESALFLFLALTSTISAWVAMWLCAKVLTMMGFRLELIVPDEPDADAEFDEAADAAYDPARPHSLA